MGERGTQDRAGAAGRVAAVHRQTRRTLLVSAAFVVAGAACAAATALGTSTPRWVAMHLFLVGGLLGAISAAAPYLAVTWSAAPAPTDAAAALQRWTLAAGAIGLVVTRWAGAPGALSALFGLSVVGSLVVLAVNLARVRRLGTVDRFRPAIDAYQLAIGYGVLGCLAGAALAAELHDSTYAQLRDAHLTLNLFGLVGLVVAGTLPYMAATQARMKMSPRATPEAVWASVAVFAAGVAVAVVGSLRGDGDLEAAGLVVVALAIVAILWILPRPKRRQFDWAGPRLVQLGTGLAWWFGATAALAWVSAAGQEPTPLRLALVVGGYAQILSATVCYLGPVLRGGGHERLSAGFRLMRSWPALVAGNVAAVAFASDATSVGVAATSLWVLDLVVRLGLLARGSVAPLEREVVQRHPGHQAEARATPEGGEETDRDR